MKTMLRANLFAVIIVVIAIGNLYAGNLILQYGFEDWTGDANTTPGYAISASASTYWANHVDSTQVIRNSASAYSGSHYLHRQFNTTLNDPLLGGTATSINDHGNFGLGGTYPQGSGNKIRLSNAITSNMITVRFRFRATDEWKNQTSVNGYCKFFRLYGTGGGDDNASAIVHLARGNNTNTIFFIYNPTGTSYGTGYYAGTDLQDGNWHSMCVQVVRNNNTNSSNNVSVRVWWDNWNMSGAPLAERTITCTSFGSAFGYFQIAQNWSAKYPSTLMGLDIDDIEIWDGSTNPISEDTTPPNQPTGVTTTVIQ